MRAEATGVERIAREHRTDHELLARSRAGDLDAFGELFDRHHRFALSVASRVAATPIDADDLVALAVENTLRAIQRGNGPTERFDHYLAIAVRRLAVRRYTSRAGREVPVDDDELQRRLGTTVVIHERDPDEAAILAALQTLSRADQEILWATEVAGWTPGEIGGETGHTSGAVAARSYRARRRLRAAFLAADPTHRPDASLIQDR